MIVMPVQQNIVILPVDVLAAMLTAMTTMLAQMIIVTTRMVANMKLSIVMIVMLALQIAVVPPLDAKMLK
jgi:hypothetical protein